MPAPVLEVGHVDEGLEAAPPLPARDVVEEVQVVAAGAGDRGGKGVVLAVAQRRPGADGAVGGVVDECPAELVDGHDAVAGGAEGVEVHDVVRIRRRLEARGGRGQWEHVHGFRIWVRLGVEQGLHVDWSRWSVKHRWTWLRPAAAAAAIVDGVLRSGRTRDVSIWSILLMDPLIYVKRSSSGREALFTLVFSLQLSFYASFGCSLSRSQRYLLDSIHLFI